MNTNDKPVEEYILQIKKLRAENEKLQNMWAAACADYSKVSEMLREAHRFLSNTGDEEGLLRERIDAVIRDKP